MKPTKLRLFTYSFLSAVLSGVVPFSVQAAELDFKACVEKALNQNPEMMVSQSRLKQAEYALEESKASRYPQITASMTASQSNNALNVFGMKLAQRQASFGDFGFSQFDSTNPNILNVKPDDLNNPGSHTDLNTRLEVLIPVWNGGKISSYQNQAKAMIKAAQHGDKAVQQYLTYNVYQAYEGVHTARAFVYVATQAVSAAEAYVKTTRNMVEQGIVVRSELLSAEVHLSEAKTALEKAKTQELIAQDSLKMLMAMDPSETLEVGPRLDVSLPSNNIDELTAMASSSNPELEAKREQTSSARAAVDASRADNYPSFNVMARGDINDESLEFANSSYTVAGVLSWKLTDFGVTSSRIGRAQAEANQQAAALRSKENQTRLQVLTAWRTLSVAQKQVASHQLAVTQAEEAQRLILKRYKSGVSTITEVLASQARLDKARADLVNSQFETNIQKAKLRLATGQMSVEQL